MRTKTAVSDFTPQRLFLHRKGILFNFSLALYHTLHNYFQENDLAPGEICLSAAQGAEIRLTPEGEIRLTGRVTVNGQEV